MVSDGRANPLVVIVFYSFLRDFLANYSAVEEDFPRFDWCYPYS